jgi:hypothetical protein
MHLNALHQAAPTHLFAFSLHFECRCAQKAKRKANRDSALETIKKVHSIVFVTTALVWVALLHR